MMFTRRGDIILQHTYMHARTDVHTSAFDKEEGADGRLPKRSELIPQDVPQICST